MAVHGILRHFAPLRNAIDTAILEIKVIYAAIEPDFPLVLQIADIYVPISLGPTKKPAFDRPPTEITTQKSSVGSGFRSMTKIATKKGVIFARRH